MAITDGIFANTTAILNAVTYQFGDAIIDLGGSNSILMVGITSGSLIVNMNLLLLMAGYVPTIIRKRDRLAYISSLEKSQLGGLKDDYEKTIANLC